VRGPGRSRSIDEALQEAKILEMQGFKEIVVTGIHLSAWGADLPGEPDLSDLITDLIEGTALTRFRLSSLEPQNFPWGILDLMEKTQRLCPHLHLPLQHGSDAVLKRMRRGYTAAQFTTIVNDFNRRFPLGGLSTDILVGFPGETSDDADALRSLIEDLPFTRLHVFKYSRRPGTPAAGFPDQVSEADKDRRSREMIALGRGKAADFARRLVGTVQEVLVENELMRGTWEGTSANYAPVLIESGEQLGGLLVQVSITRCLRERVLGGLISS
jgi:threonylcarbamoyladenosine tRNA methylthiotransferase MtaB